MISTDYESAESYFESLGIDAMKSKKPSMHRIEALCEALDHPERAIPAIHITGTNGKTSTARIATALLAATGLSVGTYTSPHLNSIRERIALSGEPISEDDFGEAFGHLWPYLELVEKTLGEKLTYFELLTAMFFLWAAEAPVDATVVEVGLGGRWDATNVVSAPVDVITNIALDHTALLGVTRESIAREKSGIIKPDASVITAERSPNVLQVISDEAASVGASLAVIERDFAVVDNQIALGGRYLSLRTSAGDYNGLFLPVHGSHQGSNAVVALEAVLRFLPARRWEQEVVAEGLSAATVPGRLETFAPQEESGPLVVFDVAHNPDGMSALVGSLIEAFPFDKIIFVVGVLGDKDYVGMLAEMGRVPCSVIATEPRTMRCVPAERLEEAAQALGLQCTVVPEVAPAVTGAVRAAGPDEIVCITGSHYVVGEGREHLVLAP
jgi:dihydrofolate synthase / folylpolyglutamate synthase